MALRIIDAHAHDDRPRLKDPAAPSVKKACDACHRRKVRCSGGQPCKNCGHASLQCTYLAIPQKKGPKGSRAKVISEIRVTQQQSVPPRHSQRYVSEPHPFFDFSSPPRSPPFPRNDRLLSQHTIDSCLHFFFDNMYTTAPIFNRQKLTDLIAAQNATSSEVYCLTAALCAFVMVQPGMTLAGQPSKSCDGEAPQSRYGFANLLLEDALRVRKGLDYVASPSLVCVQTSFFLFGSYFTLEKQNACWFHLREAATLAQIMSMHEEATYLAGDPQENIYKRRTYWLLLATERAYALERHRPLSLHATIQLPIAQGAEEEDVISGFLHLISLFRCIDDEFMALWNKAKRDCSPAWLSQLQRQLLDALPPEIRTTDNQAADIRVTLHWLRIMVWQLSITSGCLSSSSPDSSMTFKYPIEVAKDLILDISKLSLPAMEVHGVGLIEKLFDVACTLTDVIACVPLDLRSSDSNASPLALLNQFLDLISQLRGGASRYLPLLLAKVSETLPSMAPPINPLSMSIKQGYAGASDGIPTPVGRAGTMLPNSVPLHHSQDQIPFGPASAPALQQPNVNDRGLMFDTYSPSMQGSDGAMTPPLATPSPSYLPSAAVPSQLTPIPRSVPPVVGGVQFERYPG